MPILFLNYDFMNTYTLSLKSACHEYQFFINIFAQSTAVWYTICDLKEWRGRFFSAIGTGTTQNRESSSLHGLEDNVDFQKSD